MTAPRQVIAGRTYLISRRCTQRQFLLRPEPEVERIYLYCLAEASGRYDVTVHAWMIMSNHAHVIVRDNRGNFPEFLAHLHKMVAKAMNALRGRWENFWATEQPSAVWLVDASDRFDKLVYLLANPVSDHLVDRVSHWPGASSLALNLSPTTKTIRRPKTFFKKEGAMPREVTLRAERPDGFDHLGQEEWSRKLARAVRDAEERASAERARRNGRVLGRKAVLRIPPTATPATLTPRRRLSPHVACRDVTRRAEALEALRGFRASYRTAVGRWLRGERRVMFPPGTYKMQKLGAPCASPSTATIAST